jgi:thiol-disulfide isomerase/thioredoxin
MRFHLAIFAGLSLGLAHLASAQTSDFSQTILGKNAPLTLKLKDLDSNWRVFKSSSNSYLGMMSAFSPGSGSCFTKGELVTAGGTVFLIVYKPDGPDMSSLFAGGGMPKASKLTPDTTLRISLLNLQATPELEGIHVFSLSDEVKSSQSQASAIQSQIDAAKPAGGGEPTAPSEVPAASARLRKGATAPNFSVKDNQGRKVSLASYRGKVVVLDFWATWCGPCQQSLPSTNDVAAKYKKQGVVFLAVNVWDKKQAFAEWLPKHKQLKSLDFVIDPTEAPGDVATKLYKVAGIPTQYVIDRKGRVVDSIEGYGGDDAELVKNIKKALSSG